MARREAEHDALPIPNGWFAVAWSRELHAGDVKPLHYFGEDLVLFRTRSGKAQVLDPYCPHLGAHLGHGGRVMGETIRCPFHGWQFDGASGACTHIPYCERIPPKARVRAWDVQEKNGLVWVWHHAEQKPPEWDFPLLPEIGHPDWSEPRTFDLVMHAHVQDTHENNNDPVHFQFVHRSLDTPPSSIEYSADRRHYRIVSQFQAQGPWAAYLEKSSLVRDSWGLGLTAVRTEGIPGAGLLMYSSTTPIDDTKVHSRWLLTTTNNVVDFFGEEFMFGLTTGVQQDLEIWKNKVHRARPMLCEADTYLAEFRKWVKQFYSKPLAEEA
jgi:nitrite reductase/ring-hydroxylating ferredoxin subunit